MGINKKAVEAIIYHLLQVAQRNGNYDVGSTKLTKLLYLVDCEYFRWARETLTGLPWIFYHFGPYAPELIEIARSTPGISPMEPVEIEGERTFRGFQVADKWKDPLSTLPPEVRAAVGKVESRWLAADLESLLDFVYFHTAPMLAAQRSQPIDFSLIPDPRLAEKAESIRKMGDLLTPGVRDELARRLANQKKKTEWNVVSAQLPRDEECARALFEMDSEDMAARFELGALKIMTENKIC